MAVSTTPKTQRVSVKVVSGTSPTTGVAILKSVSLGTLKNTATTNEDLQKAQNIINALEPCLAYIIERTEVTTLTLLEEE